MPQRIRDGGTNAAALNGKINQGQFAAARLSEGQALSAGQPEAPNYGALAERMNDVAQEAKIAQHEAFAQYAREGLKIAALQMQRAALLARRESPEMTQIHFMEDSSGFVENDYTGSHGFDTAPMFKDADPFQGIPSLTFLMLAEEEGSAVRVTQEPDFRVAWYEFALDLDKVSQAPEGLTEQIGAAQPALDRAARQWKNVDRAASAAQLSAAGLVFLDYYPDARSLEFKQDAFDPSLKVKSYVNSSGERIRIDSGMCDTLEEMLEPVGRDSVGRIAEDNGSYRLAEFSREQVAGPDNRQTDIYSLDLTKVLQDAEASLMIE